MDIVITPNKPRPYLGREVAIEKEFLVTGTFQSMYAANSWCWDNGYDYGSSPAMKPTAITKGDYSLTDLPVKWKNFTKDDIKSVDGVITGDMREGPVFVRIFEQL